MCRRMIDSRCTVRRLHVSVALDTSSHLRAELARQPRRTYASLPADVCLARCEQLKSAEIATAFVSEVWCELHQPTRFPFLTGYVPSFACVRSSAGAVKAVCNSPSMSAAQSTTVHDGLLHPHRRHCSSPASAVRTAGCHQLFVPRHRRSMFGRRAFSVAGPAA